MKQCSVTVREQDDKHAFLLHLVSSLGGKRVQRRVCFSVGPLDVLAQEFLHDLDDGALTKKE
jgi:hypothetical protein